MKEYSAIWSIRNITCLPSGFHIGATPVEKQKTPCFEEHDYTRSFNYLNELQLVANLEYVKKKGFSKTEGYKIVELSEKIGYMNAEHFSRVFKKVIGVLWLSLTDKVNQ